MTPPLDGPGAFATITAIVLVAIALFFTFWSLGGRRLFIPDEKIHRMRDLLVPSLWIVAAMFVAAGLFFFALWFEGQQREAAWEQYDQWLLEQQTSDRPAAGR
ncbi:MULTISPECIES: hypothetical protein [unclassified Isoptericola]|uniref:hypothetical protein n=1 Tax=unclassified Isoptericola TaxID=2623355 RepID=UPI00364B47D1